MLLTRSGLAQNQKDSSGTRHHSIIALPFVSRSIETDWTFGAAGSFTFHINAKDSLTRTSNLQALGYYSLNKQFMAGLDGSVYFPREDYIAHIHLSYSFYPDQFWGLGQEAPDSVREPYNFRQYYVFLHGQRAIGRNVFAGMLYEYQKLIDVDYVSGGLFDSQDVTGRDPYHVSGLGASLSYDTRNNSFYPEKGTLLLLSFTHFNAFFRSDYRYASYKVDMRHFWKPYAHHVLAMQFVGLFNGGKKVPLRSLASMGGSSLMRGYYDGRYRDRNLMALQAEYRLPLFWRLGMVLFGSTGEVSSRLAQFGAEHVRFSYGGGLRVALNRAEKMNLRLDYGVGQGKSHGFYLQFGEAF